MGLSDTIGDAIDETWKCVEEDKGTWEADRYQISEMLIHMYSCFGGFSEADAREYVHLKMDVIFWYPKTQPK